MKKLVLRNYKSDLKLIIIFFFITALIYIIFNGSSLDLIKFSDQSSQEKEFKLNTSIDLFDKKNINKINEFHIEIEEEYQLGLNASLPKKEKCLKVRYKYAPIKHFSIDKKIPKGKVFIKYRGYCDPHWYSNQKSIKIKLKADHLFGYNTFNLNAMTSDPMFFDKFYGDILRKNGGISTRIKFVKLFINGKYDGLRQLVQNLDDDLIRSDKLEPGSIYRERVNANYGEDFPLWKLKTLWKRNSKNRAEKWYDFRDFQRKIANSVKNKSDQFKLIFDEKMYLKYLSILMISGTDNMGSHNIPIYRPLSEKKFKPIGYDFSVMKDPVPLQSLKIKDMQNNYINFNWLSSLYWNDIKFRKKLYKTTAEMLKKENFVKQYRALIERIEPILKKEINQKYQFRNFNNFQKIKEHGLNRLNTRINYLKKMLLFPEIFINPKSKLNNEFQFLINGLGVYELDIKIKKTKCSESINNSIKIELQLQKKINILICKNNYYATKKIILERNDIEAPNLNNNKTTRNSLGGILVNVKNYAGIKIEKITVISKQTNKAVPKDGFWPFNIKKETKNLISLGRNLIFNNNNNLILEKGSYQIFDVNKNQLYSFELFDKKYIGNTKKAFFSYKRNEVLSYWDPEEFGPILCWNFDKGSNLSKSGKGCYEFSKNLFQNDSKIKSQNDNYDKVLTAKDIIGCKVFNFKSVKYLILETLIFPKNCKVIFSENAKLFFKSQIYMVINGKYIFPKNDKKVYFQKADKVSWGGLIIKYQGKNLIQNAFFSGGGEFIHEGKRYTGVLNLDNVPFVKIIKSIFISNTGDDALNVIDSESEIMFNYFSKNRDAIDIDLGKSSIKYNIFKNNQDDAIDLGTVKFVDISYNIINGSGDKGVSIGEQSNAILNTNLIKENNIGIAIKDGSKADINNNKFINNFIAKSMYTKITLKENSYKNKKNIVAGMNFYKNNKYKLKVDNKKIELSDKNLKEKDLVLNLENKITLEFKKECIECLMY